MTSSLVGSEMCIRDSNVSDLASQTHQPTGTDGIETDTLPVSSYAVGDTPCLLYTSDAADDM
eukprot:2154457-Prorocentrum_lima.AAC.1